MYKYLPLVIAVVTLIAGGGVGNGEPIPVFDVIDGVVSWFPSESSSADIHGGYVEYCNDDHAVPMLMHASVEPSSRMALTGGQIDWEITKPGDYAALPAVAILQSNGDVVFEFQDVYNLANEERHEIPTEYAVLLGRGKNPPVPGPDDWMPAERLNDPDASILAPAGKDHEPIVAWIWIRLAALECESASRYFDRWTLTCELFEQKPWVERD